MHRASVCESKTPLVCLDVCPEFLNPDVTREGGLHLVSCTYRSLVEFHKTEKERERESYAALGSDREVREKERERERERERVREREREKKE